MYAHILLRSTERKLIMENILKAFHGVTINKLTKVLCSLSEKKTAIKSKNYPKRLEIVFRFQMNATI